MIKKLIVENYVGELFELPIVNSNESPYAITSITGLACGDVDINTTDIATMDGSLFNSARIQARNVTLNFRLRPNTSVSSMLGSLNTVEKVRHELYKMFPSKEYVKVHFVADTRQVFLEGYVEKHEVEIFSQNETTQVSLVCPNPFFQNEAVKDTVLSGVEPMFKFPFNVEIKDPVEDTGIIMGRILFYVERNIYYQGEAETGFYIYCHAVGTVKDITFYNVTTREKFKISMSKVAAIVGSNMGYADDIEICTVRGSKYVIFIRDGVKYNILNAVDKNSSWFQLKPGDNIFTYVCSEDTSLNLQVSASYRSLFNGL